MHAGTKGLKSKNIRKYANFFPGKLKSNGSNREFVHRNDTFIRIFFSFFFVHPRNQEKLFFHLPQVIDLHDNDFIGYENFRFSHSIFRSLNCEFWIMSVSYWARSDIIIIFSFEFKDRLIAWMWCDVHTCEFHYLNRFIWKWNQIVTFNDFGMLCVTWYEVSMYTKHIVFMFLGLYRKKKMIFIASQIQWFSLHFWWRILCKFYDGTFCLFHIYLIFFVATFTWKPWKNLLEVKWNIESMNIWFDSSNLNLLLFNFVLFCIIQIWFFRNYKSISEYRIEDSQRSQIQKLIQNQKEFHVLFACWLKLIVARVNKCFFYLF